MNFPGDLKPGDVLQYSTPDLVDWIIETKTGDNTAHVEVYAGDGQSAASRNGVGVSIYPFRSDGLIYVRRPHFFDATTAGQWFETVRGEGYDWLGLLAFDNIVKQGQPHHLFCSAFATLYLRAGGVEVFAPDFPAGKVSPRDFKLSPALHCVWQK